MSRRLPGHAQFYRSRWRAWFTAQFAPFNAEDTGRRRLVAMLQHEPPCGFRGVKLSPSRVTSWLNEERVPDAMTAYRVGTALRKLGASTHGAVALIIAGHLIPELRFIRQCALVDPALAVALCADLPDMLDNFSSIGIAPMVYVAADEEWHTDAAVHAAPEKLSAHLSAMLERRTDEIDEAFAQSLEPGKLVPRRFAAIRGKNALGLSSRREAQEFALFKAWQFAGVAVAAVTELQPYLSPREIEARGFDMMREFVYYLTQYGTAAASAKAK